MTAPHDAHEACVVASIVEAGNAPLPRLLSRILDAAPESCDDQRRGQILVQIRAMRQAGLPVSPVAVAETVKFDGAVLYIQSILGEAVSLELAEREAEPVWATYQQRRFSTVLADARYAFERSPSSFTDISKHVIESLSGVVSDGPGAAPFQPWLKLVQDAKHVTSMELPPVVQIVDGIVAEHSKLAIVSGAKSFKTWLTIYLALAISHNTLFLERRTIRKRVLYVNLELKQVTFNRRLQTIGKALGITIDPEWFYHLALRGQMAQVSVHELVSRIIAIAKHLKVEVVVIDPVFKANTEGEENSSRDQTVFFNELDRITTEAQCTVILNDHSGKGNQSEKDPLDVIRGSSAKGGDLDAAMVLRKHEAKDCFRIDLVHRELPPVEPFVVEWKYPLMHLREDLNAENMKKSKGGATKKHDSKRILAAIKDTSPANAISISAWAERAQIKRPTLQNYLPEMRSQGWIATAGEGSTARQYITKKGLETLKEDTE